MLPQQHRGKATGKAPGFLLSSHLRTDCLPSREMTPSLTQLSSSTSLWGGDAAKAQGTGTGSPEIQVLTHSLCPGFGSHASNYIMTRGSRANRGRDTQAKWQPCLFRNVFSSLSKGMVSPSVSGSFRAFMTTPLGTSTRQL